MRFDGLRTRSASALPKPKPAAANVRPQRGHSVLPPSSMPIPHAMKPTMPVPASPLADPSSAASTKPHADSALPSVDKLFPRPDLEARMKKHLVRVANETSNALIRDTLAQNEPGSVLWRPAQRPRGSPGTICMLRGAARGASEAKDATCVRAVSDNVHASIEEFALLFKLDSSREAADHLLLFNADLLQHATLYTLVSPSGQQPRRYVGVKWALVASPSRFFRNRDFCYLECQKEFTDANGRRGWVRSLHSLNLPCCPSLEKEHGVVRASIYRSGLTAVETDEPGVLSVTYTVELDLKGRAALELLQPGFLAQRVAALATVDKLLQQQRLSSSPLLGDLEIPVRKRTRSSCNLCFREFATTGGIRDTFAAITSLSTKSKRYLCRKCGEGVCRRCSDDWWLDVPVVGRTKVRICTVCSAEAKQSHISAHTTRAGTCPAIGQLHEPMTEFTGITHPDLLPQRARRRSLSMIDRSNVATNFFAEQEEMNRDIEIRTTELNRRVQVWDEVQMYNRDSSAILDNQLRAPKDGLRERRELENNQLLIQQEREQEKQLKNAVVLELEKEEEKEEDEPKVELVPQRRQAQSVYASQKPEHQELVDRYPSFMSSDVSSSQEHSENEGDETIRLTSDTGTQIPLDCGSNLSDYEEHTIDGLGKIRTTTDLTRWWHDQNQSSMASVQPQGRQSPRISKLVNDHVRMAKLQHQAHNRRASVAISAVKRQELVDMVKYPEEGTYNIDAYHQPQRLSYDRRQQMPELEAQARYNAQQSRCQQHSDFEEMAQYQEEQVRRRYEVLDVPTRPIRSVESDASVLHEIMQHQRELDKLRHQSQQPHDDEPPSSHHFLINSQFSAAAKERYLDQQRQLHLGIATESNKETRLNSKKTLDQTAGEDAELMETSQGEWVPITEAFARKVNFNLTLESSPLHNA
ncbi:hypothetical protein CCR75_001455 [Bremia lactucae]|uniref:FYVE-type domain-containing protein n=1 Tax=Bremia lactucae TaxID=4779 RepID=A0A976ILT8_BRELC|nr:hypothetical protein CCR75_001455 [Bremia lactucae]